MGFLGFDCGAALPETADRAARQVFPRPFESLVAPAARVSTFAVGASIALRGTVWAPELHTLLPGSENKLGRPLGRPAVCAGADFWREVKQATVYRGFKQGFGCCVALHLLHAAVYLLVVCKRETPARSCELSSKHNTLLSCCVPVCRLLLLVLLSVCCLYECRPGSAFRCEEVGRRLATCGETGA